MKNTDYLRKFILDSHNVRGKILRSSEQINQILLRHYSPFIVSKTLFELMVFGSLMTSDLKTDSIITIQISSPESPVKMVVVDIDSNLNISACSSIDY